VRIDVDLLRELFRNLAQWRSIFTSDQVDQIHCPDGQTLALADVEYLYLVSQQVLPVRQRQAIRWCLVMNLSEQDAAEIMKIEDTNPVAMYATSGLETIVHMYQYGLLPTRAEVYAHDSISRNRTVDPTYTTKFILPLEAEMGSFNLAQEIEDPFLVV
jgi:hypothetical protein